MNKKLGNPKRIAVLRALKIGDMLVAVPALRALRAAFPKSEISLVGLPWAKDFVKRFNKYIDKFIVFPGFPGLPEQSFNSLKIINFIKEMKSRRFDLAIQLWGDGSIINPLIELLESRKIAGFFRSGDYCPNDKTFIKYPERENEIKKNLHLLEFLGIKSQGEFLELPLFEKEIKIFKLKFKSLKLKDYIVVHPGASITNKRWDLNNFIFVTKKILERGHPVILTGTQNEKLITSKIKSQFQNNVFDLAGETDFAQLSIFIKNSRLLIGNDTSVSHIAAAFEIPSVIISFLSNDQLERWSPLDKKLHRIVNGYSQDSLKSVLKQII